MAAFQHAGYRLGVEKVEDEPHGIYIPLSLATYFKQTQKFITRLCCQLTY